MYVQKRPAETNPAISSAPSGGQIGTSQLHAIAQRLQSSPRGQTASALHQGLNGSSRNAPVQRKIIVGGEELPETTEVSPQWNFSPRDARIFQIWLKDESPRLCPSLGVMVAAIKRSLSAQELMAPEAQPFGTDIGLAYPDKEQQVAIFINALKAGYRTFDSAATYGTLEALAEAVDKFGLSMDDITVIYKIKPNDDAKTDKEITAAEQTLLESSQENPDLLDRLDEYLKDPSAHAEYLQTPGFIKALSTKKQIRDLKNAKNEALLATAKQQASGLPGVLMLHETHSSLQVTKEALWTLIHYVKTGEARAVGVSNVDITDLTALYQFSVEQGCPIVCVENQFSPYLRDEEVREFCQEHGITYISYGLMGSAQVGACAGVGDDGEGLPTRYLLARHDPRLKALAKETGLSEGELLAAWAHQHGVQPVLFSSDAGRAAKNFTATTLQLPQKILQRLDEMFIAPSAEAEDKLEEKSPELQALYNANKDPTAWHVLDSLTAQDATSALLERIVTDIGIDNEGGLQNFILNLIRHVADIQSNIQRSKESGITDWRENIIPAFENVAAAASDNDFVFGNFAKWATKDALAGHTSADAMGVLTTIATNTEPPQLEEQIPDLEPQPEQDTVVPYAETDVAGWEAYQGVLDENYTPLTTTDIEGLQADTRVFWQQKPMRVVSNDALAKNLTLAPVQEE